MTYSTVGYANNTTGYHIWTVTGRGERVRRLIISSYEAILQGDEYVYTAEETGYVSIQVRTDVLFLTLQQTELCVALWAFARTYGDTP